MPAMQCAVCDAAAPTVCANCGTAAYCSKEHQRQHWPQHRQGCFPCALQRSDQLGRFLATTRAVAAGTLLVKEWPLVVGPCAGARPLCLGCHCPLPATGHRCTACGAALCDDECEKLAAHSEWECRVLGAAQGARGGVLDGRPELVLPLRCLLGVRSGTADWMAFLDLEAHLDARRSRPVWEERQKGVVEVLKSAGLVAADGAEDELLQRVCAILDVNSFEVRGPAQGLAGQQAGEQLRAVFLRAAMMSHSCVPNVQLAVDDQLQLTVRASCDLPRGTAVRYNYCELLETTLRRQEHLLEGKYFECSCERCADPTECGTHLSSLWCPHCHAGLVSPARTPPSKPPPDSRTPSAPRSRKPLPPGATALPASCSPRTRRPSSPSSWRCGSCGGGVSSRAALSASRRCAEQWESARRGGEDGADEPDARSLEALLVRLSRTLPPQHAVQLAAKQVLVAMYRDAVLSTRRPGAHALLRMQQLCQEILEVLDRLLPDRVSRLKGIALHELHVAVALGGRDGEVQHLQRARDLLRASLHHLQHEPKESPEGRLHLLALQELDAVEDSIRQDIMAQVDKAGAKVGKARRGKKRQ